MIVAGVLDDAELYREGLAAAVRERASGKLGAQVGDALTTPKGLRREGYAAVDALVAHFVPLTIEILSSKKVAKLQVWRNVQRKGSYVEAHDHSGAHWVVTYYVAVAGSGSRRSERPTSRRMGPT